MAQEGTLIAKAYTSVGQIPVPDVFIQVTRSDTVPPELLAVRLTDSSGLTPQIRIATPNRENTLQPGEPIGWTNVDIAVEHPLFERIEVDHVQIFPGVETVQELQLIPMARLPEVFNRTEFFNIPPQDL